MSRLSGEKPLKNPLAARRQRKPGTVLFSQLFLGSDPDFDKPLKIKVVGTARFELTTSCSQSRRSTKLSYVP